MNAKTSSALTRLTLYSFSQIYFLSEGILKTRPPSLWGFIIQHDFCACWGRLTVMCDVIQIVIWFFRIWITLFFSSSSVSVCLIYRHPSILLLSPGLRCTYHQQHLVILNYDLSADQPLMGLEEEERGGSLERSAVLLSAPPVSYIFFSFLPSVTYECESMDWFPSMTLQTPSTC